MRVFALLREHFRLARRCLSGYLEEMRNTQHLSSLRSRGAWGR